MECYSVIGYYVLEGKTEQTKGAEEGLGAGVRHGLLFY